MDYFQSIPLYYCNAIRISGVWPDSLANGTGRQPAHSIPLMLCRPFHPTMQSYDSPSNHKLPLYMSALSGKASSIPFASKSTIISNALYTIRLQISYPTQKTVQRYNYLYH